MKGWIQSSDFSVADIPGELDAVRAIWHFATHDWEAEQELERARVAQDRVACPASIGFDADDGACSLIVYPQSGGSNLVFVRCIEARRALGFVRRPALRWLQREGVSNELVQQLLRSFFQGDCRALADILNAPPGAKGLV